MACSRSDAMASAPGAECSRIYAVTGNRRILSVVIAGAVLVLVGLSRPLWIGPVRVGVPRVL
jgi:hypothetical protein